MSASLATSTSDLVSGFMEAKRIAGLSHRTLERYGQLLRLFANERPTLPLDAESIETFVDEHRGRSDETAAKVYRTVRTFYGWCERRRAIAPSKNPMKWVEKPKVSTKMPRALTEAQALAVVQASRPPFERALVVTLLDSGARIGELVNATKDDLVGRALRVRGKTGERMVPLSAATVAYLRELPTHYLFPGRIGLDQPWSRIVVDKPSSRDALGLRVRRIMWRAGITGPKMGPHTLRHTFASLFLKQSGNLYGLSRLLGHNSIRMSERYVALDFGYLAGEHAKYSPLRTIIDVDAKSTEYNESGISQDEGEGDPSILPAKVREYPLSTPDGKPVWIKFRVYHRHGNPYYAAQARVSNKLTYICSLRIPEKTVEAVAEYRRAIRELNRQRAMQRREEGVAA